MEEQNYEALADRYRDLPVEELLKLNERKPDLTALAQQALTHEVSRRGADVEAAKKTQANDEASDLAWAERQADIAREREVRKDRRFKWYLILATPFVIYAFVSALRDPREPVPTSLYLLLGSMALAWTSVIVRWRISSRRKRAESDRDA